MASAREISRRIRGISSTMQITRAMEMVSSVKLRQVRAELEKSRPYYNTVLENIQEVLESTNVNHHPLLKKRKIESSLIIILASDRGLAGAYNANINRFAKEVIDQTQGDIELITVGIKPYDYFKRRGYKIVESFSGISEDIDFGEAQHIGRTALDLYKSGQVDQIKVVYTHFGNLISYKPSVLTLLPYVDKEVESHSSSVLMEFEPSPEVTLDYLIPMYINSAIFGAIIESSVSEQAARQIAMESATENAEELRDELQLKYNRIRQEAITLEITEIVSGAEALK